MNQTLRYKYFINEDRSSSIILYPAILTTICSLVISTKLRSSSSLHPINCHPVSIYALGYDHAHVSKLCPLVSDLWCTPNLRLRIVWIIVYGIRRLGFCPLIDNLRCPNHSNLQFRIWYQLTSWTIICLANDEQIFCWID